MDNQSWRTGGKLASSLVDQMVLCRIWEHTGCVPPNRLDPATRKYNDKLLVLQCVIWDKQNVKCTFSTFCCVSVLCDVTS